ncbi:Golgi transport complex subunit 3 [Lunasporangiospora selenospora]|uniref:Conserved oligomeric Golgi complex subunit 3 n=1 Tax=Lunasporangiospora selenospora TaxID=979761 RepID=A0A9P6G1W5_9FUNG|nr:Golgi transport complex subunit 3 [Lunasporangiospora selenospora]
MPSPHSLTCSGRVCKNSRMHVESFHYQLMQVDLAVEFNSPLPTGRSNSSTDVNSAPGSSLGVKPLGNQLLSVSPSLQPVSSFSPKLHASKESGTLSRSKLDDISSIDGVNVDEYEAGQPDPIETTQKFLDWFSTIEGKMERDQEDVYRNYLTVVQLYKEACDGFLTQINETSTCFQDLEGHYEFVEEKTRALQLACEKLLHEQNNLQTLADTMASKLSYFHQLEAVTRLFNAPGEDVCLQPEFTPMLAKLDECLEYVQQNPKYKDSELYQMRFRQCMTRGMTLIKMHMIAKLRALSVEVVSKKPILAKGESIKPAMATALFYVKFRTVSPPLRTLVAELEKRCVSHKEYNSLLNDCYNCYFSIRQQHLEPMIISKIQEMGPSQENKLQFARVGLAYLTSVCMDEYTLFYNFFNTGEDALYGFLDTLIGYLYDYLRPRIIHENKINTLSELCVVMNVQQSDIPIDENSHLAFGYLIRNMLQDTQQRLVYRAQALIRAEIQGFKPKPADLDYPACLQASDSVSTADSIPEVSSPTPSVAGSISSGYFTSPTIHELDTGDMYHGWYPTLKTTLKLLTMIYKCVNQTIFDDLSQEALSKCLISLKQVSTTIRDTKHPVDGQLFLIKHFLILKEQIAPFEGNFVHTTKEVDFSRMTDAIATLFRDRGSLLSFGSWFGAVSQTITPTLVDSYLDARQEIDRDLKLVCETFILDMGKAAVNCLAKFMDQVAGLRIRADVEASQRTQDLSMNSGPLRRPPVSLKNKPYARPEELQKIMFDFKESVPQRIQWTVLKLSTYLRDPNTEMILMRPIQSFIIESYQSFYDTILYEYDPTLTLQAAQDPNGFRLINHPGMKDLEPVEKIAGWVSDLVRAELRKNNPEFES